MLAVDLGTARIGVAVSDPDRRLARPAGVVRCKGARADARAIRELAGEGVTLLVVGLPLSLGDEEEGPSARRARERGEDLARRLRLPVEWVDETLTTAEAQQALIASGASRRRRQEQLDAMAAVLILETWMRQREQAAAREGR